jgi:peptidyl-prolyl cis-trans isomerase SurA
MTMIKNVLFAGSILFAVLFSFPLQGTASGAVVVDSVIAVVNDEVITLSDLQREEALHKKKNEARRDTHSILDDMIDRKLQMAAAKRTGMEVTDKELDEAMADIMKRNNMSGEQFTAALAKEGLALEQYRIELREQMTLSRVFNKFVRSGISVDEAEARAFYEKNANAYVLPEEIRMRRIFLPLPSKAKTDQIAAVKEKAQVVYERAKKGSDFTTLVRETSKDATAMQDGDLGFMQRDQVIPEIAEAIRTLKPGEITKPFLSAGGYNIILLEEVRTPALPYEKVKDDIINTLYQQKMDHTYRTWLQSLRGDSHIEKRL